MDEKLFKLRFFCKDINLDDRTKDYVLKRLQKLEKFLKSYAKYEIEVSMDKKNKFYVEIMVRTPYKLYRAQEISESVEGSTDMVIEDLQKQIVGDKKKIKELRERGARSIKKKMTLDKNSRF